MFVHLFVFVFFLMELEMMWDICKCQSLEFISGPRILTEMIIENRGKIYFPWTKIDKHRFFFL